MSNIRGLNEEEYEDIRIISSGLTMIISKLTPLEEGSNKCATSILTKTLVTPIVDLDTKTTLGCPGQ